MPVFLIFMPDMEHPNTDLYPWGGPYTSVHLVIENVHLGTRKL